MINDYYQIVPISLPRSLPLPFFVHFSINHFYLSLKHISLASFIMLEYLTTPFPVDQGNQTRQITRSLAPPEPYAFLLAPFSPHAPTPRPGGANAEGWGGEGGPPHAL